MQDRSAATDPTAIPPSCRTAAPAVAERLGPILTTAGLQANAKNFAHTFVITLWLLIAVSAGIFALPNRIAQPPSIANGLSGNRNQILQKEGRAHVRDADPGPVEQSLG